jgi:hypothetical protein
MVERIRIVAVYIMVWRYMPRFMALGSSAASFGVWLFTGKASRILLTDSPKPHADSQHCVTDGRLVVDLVEDTRRYWRADRLECTENDSKNAAEGRKDIRIDRCKDSRKDGMSNVLSSCEDHVTYPLHPDVVVKTWLKRGVRTQNKPWKKYQNAPRKQRKPLYKSCLPSHPLPPSQHALFP